MQSSTLSIYKCLFFTGGHQSLAETQSSEVILNSNLRPQP